MERTGKHKVRLLNKIGQGAFGEVYKGTFDGATVAVKTVSSDLGSVEYELFIREANALRSFSHPNIITFRALCKLNANDKHGRCVLVLEYAKDGTLFAKVSKQMMSAGGLGGSKVYSNADALRWALGVAEALEYLHLRTPAIFHRDVKLSNIMLTTDADGKSVAKISDFGLHVVADSTRDRELRVGGRSSLPVAKPAQQHLQQLGSSGPIFASEAAAGEAVAAGARLQWNDSARQRADGSGRSSLPASDFEYSELHDSGRKMSFVGSGGQQQVLQQAEPQAAGTDAAQQLDQSNHSNHSGRAMSFRRASHHPGGDMAASRVHSSSMGLYDDSSYNRHYGLANDLCDDTRSMCSMATDATWANSSVCGSDDGSMESDVETVFDMTGQTGSSLYMAPEVCNGERYNEKADVFSFGVVLYELMARCLIMFTELPTSSTDPAVADRYAQKVAKGYRPAKPKRMPDNVWQLIEACWQQDPVKRPHMSEVVSVLRNLLAADATTGKASSRGATSQAQGGQPGSPGGSTVGSGSGSGSGAAASFPADKPAGGCCTIV